MLKKLQIYLIKLRNLSINVLLIRLILDIFNILNPYKQLFLLKNLLN